MRFVPVDAGRGAKEKQKEVESDSPSRQSERPPPIYSAEGRGLGGQGLNEALMPLLLMQQQMLFQQQQAASAVYLGPVLPPIHAIYAVQTAEYAPALLTPASPHAATLPRRRSPPERRRSPPEQPSSSSSHKAHHTTHPYQPSSPVGSTGDRGFHLQLYIDWLKVQSPSLAGADLPQTK